MHDVEFMIVNSKQPVSQLMLPQLQARVSFKVHQETAENPIWTLMEGGKDDIYVYDRCGRLSYYIPFPLSIIHDQQPIVYAAILDTHFRSPCGLSCDSKGQSAVEAFMRQEGQEDDGNAVTSPLREDMEVDDDDFSDSSNTTRYINNTDFENISVEPTNHTLSNENYNETAIDDDYDFNETKAQIPKNENGFFSRVFQFFWKYENRNKTGTIPDSNDTLTPTAMEDNVENVTEGNGNLTAVSNATAADNATENTVEDNNSQARSSRCLEADHQVCKNWSKRRLLHAQMCCAFNADGVFKRPESCQRFGKKRCKKTQTILKCCLKTALAEASPEEERVETTTTMTVEERVETTTTTTVDAVESTTPIAHTVCCEEIGSEKRCYVSETLECDPEGVGEKTVM